jgi:hypothetical protein
MRTVFIRRSPDDGFQTLGAVSVAKTDGSIFLAKTLELAWKNNESNISCIPVGNYLCKWTRSNRLSKLAGHDVFTYEVLGVPGRAGIRIHSANYFFQLLGCISMGDAHKDINADQKPDTIHSGATVLAFNQEMNQEDFILSIAA